MYMYVTLVSSTARRRVSITMKVNNMISISKTGLSFMYHIMHTEGLLHEQNHKYIYTLYIEVITICTLS